MTYDLTGLPPTPAEVEAFVADTSPGAYEALVDRLLFSPHYGEQWGRHWLDLVRYAETNSYERDNPKPHAWRYRDYVIRSFNDDKPYDRFIREQLAGDEMPDADDDAIIATGYYRLGIWDDEPSDHERAQLRRARRHRRDHRPSVSGADRQLRPLPRPQDRSDSAEGLLPAAVVLRRSERLSQWRPDRRDSARRAIRPRPPIGLLVTREVRQKHARLKASLAAFEARFRTDYLRE